MGLPRSTTGPQFTYTGFFNQAFWGRPHLTHIFWHLNGGAFKMNHRATIYIYQILNQHFGAGHTKHTSFCTLPVGLSRSTTGPQFTYTGFFKLGIFGLATLNTPVLAYDQWGFQDQPQGHNLHILDFLIGHFGAGHTKHTSIGI